MALVAGKVADGSILALVEAFLGQSVLENNREWVPEQGTPQGAVISPLLSNIYLDPLDHLMAGRGFEMVRYADDFVVLCPPPSQGQAPPTRSCRGPPPSQGHAWPWCETGRRKPD
jgi:RNA-directed DNA polymerase